MKKIKKVRLNKVAALAIIVSVSGSGSTAYAVTLSKNKSSNASTTTTTNSQHYKSSITIKRKLDSLVDSESINQFQEAAVIKYLGNFKQSLRNSNIDKLSTTGTVSNTQGTIISNLFTTYKNSISKAIKSDFSSKLDSLVNLGTITELQKNAIVNLCTISKNSNVELVGLDTLVTNETLTKDQEITTINSFMQSKNTTTKTINEILLSKLDKSVLDGTINDTQRNAVINLAKIQTVDSQNLELHRRLDTLVAVGTITKDNEMDIINALLSGTN